MARQPHRRLDVYTELCPALSGAVIGAGIVTGMTESVTAGVVFLIAGAAIGITAPVVRAMHTQTVKKTPRRKD